MMLLWEAEARTGLLSDDAVSPGRGLHLREAAGQSLSESIVATMFGSRGHFRSTRPPGSPSPKCLYDWGGRPESPAVPESSPRPHSASVTTEPSSAGAGTSTAVGGGSRSAGPSHRIRWRRWRRAADAVSLLHRSIAQNHGNVFLLRSLAQVLILNQECDQAEEVLKLYASTDPKDGRVGLLRGDCLARQNRTAEAIASYRQAIARDSNRVGITARERIAALVKKGAG